MNQQLIAMLTETQRLALIDALDQYVANEGEHVEDLASEGKATLEQIERLQAAEKMVLALNVFRNNRAGV